MPEKLVHGLGGLAVVLVAVSWLPHEPAGAAPPTNGTYTILQDMLASGGGPVGSGNPMSAITLLGNPVGGSMANATFTIIGGDTAIAGRPSGASMLVTVTGSIDDPTATVSVSANGAPGVAATIVGSQFTAANVRLYVGPNTISATATDPLGNTSTISMTVYVDLPATLKTPSLTVDVIGSIDDPTASVTVNGIAATIASGQFTAKAVPLTDGFNVISATATDPAGNSATKTISVFVDTTPPARPTVGTLGAAVPAVTTATSLTLSGTKTQGTSIWINGKPVVPINDETIWVAAVSLVEGDNELHIVAKDVAGNPSAENFVNVIVDNLPPVLSSLTYVDTSGQPLQVDPKTGLPKTNFTPVTLSGQVDDSKTTVTINGITATRNIRAFTVEVPLPIEGANSLTVIATSPNGFVTTKPLTIIRGTIPTIASIQPMDGTKLYTGTTTTIQATATDKENDPLQCQILVDGVVVVDWFAGASHPWTPTEAQRGLHTIEVRVRDGFGGYASKQAGVFVGRAQIKPLSP